MRLKGIVVLLACGIALSATAPVAHAWFSRLDDQIAQARALQKKGAIDQALQRYESLLPELQSGAPSPQLAQVLSGISQVSLSRGDYSKGIESARKAVGIYHTLSDWGGEARALNDKGVAEIEHGDYSAAQVDLKDALLLSRKAGDAETEVKTLNNQGSAYFFQGKYTEANRNYQQAAQLVAQHSQQAWGAYWTQITDFNQATLYQRLGQYQNALQIYRGVKDSSDKHLDASDKAHLYTNLGALYRRLGDPVKALESYQSALSFYAKQRDEDGEIGTLKNIGIVHAMDLNNNAKAQQVFEQALALAKKSHNQREEMQGHLYLGETLFRKQKFEPARREFQTALTAAKTLGTTEEQWKAWYGLGRVDELQGKTPAAESDYREAISVIESTRAQLQLSALRAEFLADKRDAYNALIHLLLNKNNVPESFLFLERSRARTFQDRLTEGQASAPAPTLAETQQHLSADTILFEFWTSEDRVALIWCTRTNFGMSQKQLSGPELQSIRDLLQGFPHNLNSDNNSDNWQQRVLTLRILLPDNLSFMQENLKHLLIVPDGWLSFVPFDLVPTERGSHLLDRFDISYLPTAALLRREPRRAKLHMPWTRELVAFGDPASHRESADFEPMGGGGADTAALPYSSKEVESISAMASGKTELFLGSKDLKSSFLGGKADGAMLLHVSTHAVADADNPENSRLQFSASDPQAAPDYVYLRELYGLELEGVDLATLSACDTERGKMIRGEGVEAFSRALLSAGSRASLTTLGRVDDEATAEFMKQFYYYALEKRQAKAEALRSAKLKFLHSGTKLSNPAYWAAFVLNGDGSEAVPRVISWKELAASVMAALLLTLLAISFLRNWRRSHG